MSDLRDVDPVPGPPLRVALADDQTLVRQGIRSLLELDGAVSVVGEAADGEAAVALVEAERPDVLLLDLRMPRLDGIGTLRALAARGAGVPTLVLTTFDDDEAVLGALRAGARGYLLKDVTLRDLVEGIRAVATGGRLVLPPVGTAAGPTAGAPDGQRRGAAGFESHDRPEPLTGREVEVLRLLAGGYSNREVAAALHLSEGTVKNHVSAVLAKLGVRDRTRAVLRGLELGLLSR